jgi:hypothetical protein
MEKETWGELEPDEEGKSHLFLSYPAISSSHPSLNQFTND